MRYYLEWHQRCCSLYAFILNWISCRKHIYLFSNLVSKKLNVRLKMFQGSFCYVRVLIFNTLQYPCMIKSFSAKSYIWNYCCNLNNDELFLRCFVVFCFVRNVCTQQVQLHIYTYWAYKYTKWYLLSEMLAS